MKKILEEGQTLYIYLSRISLSLSHTHRSLSHLRSWLDCTGVQITLENVNLAQCFSFNTVCKVTSFLGFDPSINVNKNTLICISLSHPLSCNSLSFSHTHSLSHLRRWLDCPGGFLILSPLDLINPTECRQYSSVLGLRLTRSDPRDKKSGSETLENPNSDPTKLGKFV